MSERPNAPVPPGWYPDPAGLRQWRVWNGSDWSNVTESFGPITHDVLAPVAAEDPSVARTLGRLRTYGIASLYGGVGLLLSALAHWPGTHQPESRTFALLTSSLALVLLVIGTATFAVAVRALQGHWTFDAALPGINTLAVNVLVSRRLGLQSVGWRLGSELFLLIVICAQFHRSPWLVLGLVLLTYSYQTRVALLLEQLRTPVAASTTAS